MKKILFMSSLTFILILTSSVVTGKNLVNVINVHDDLGVFIYSALSDYDNQENNLLIYKDNDLYTTTNISVYEAYSGAIMYSKIDSPIVARSYLVSGNIETVINKTIIWDTSAMEDVVEKLENYETELENTIKLYNRIKVLVNRFTASFGKLRIIINAVIQFYNYRLNNKINLMESHADLVQNIHANIKPLFKTNDIVVEIVTVYNSSGFYMEGSSRYYSNYNIISKVYKRDDYLIYLDFKDCSYQQIDEIKYYNNNCFAGDIRFVSSSKELSDNLIGMLAKDRK